MEDPAGFLKAAGLWTVADILERAKSTPGPEAQRPYTALRRAGLPTTAVVLIGDALVDAGIIKTYGNEAAINGNLQPGVSGMMAEYQ